MVKYILSIFDLQQIILFICTVKLNHLTN